MENAFTEIRAIRIHPGFLSLLQNSGRAFGKIRETPGRLAKALRIEREPLFFEKAILPGGKWGEKNEVSFDALTARRGIPCKPIHAWSMILQENKIRK
jgi:3-methyladenine DNA glycosylase Mpg